MVLVDGHSLAIRGKARSGLEARTRRVVARPCPLETGVASAHWPLEENQRRGADHGGRRGGGRARPGPGGCGCPDHRPPTGRGPSADLGGEPNRRRCRGACVRKRSGAGAASSAGAGSSAGGRLERLSGCGARGDACRRKGAQHGAPERPRPRRRLRPLPRRRRRASRAPFATRRPLIRPGTATRFAGARSAAPPPLPRRPQSAHRGQGEKRRDAVGLGRQ
mmetsp:Transcript_101771/g.283504  ORF Transcript_101771/g.283504 Transcript_101771/m.283504 type:complete len:221 (-) Transcript_101771:29-691(-)